MSNNIDGGAGVGPGQPSLTPLPRLSSCLTNFLLLPQPSRTIHGYPQPISLPFMFPHCHSSVNEASIRVGGRVMRRCAACATYPRSRHLEQSSGWKTVRHFHHKITGLTRSIRRYYCTHPACGRAHKVFVHSGKTPREIHSIFH